MAKHRISVVREVDGVQFDRLLKCRHHCGVGPVGNGRRGVEHREGATHADHGILEHAECRQIALQEFVDPLHVREEDPQCPDGHRPVEHTMDGDEENGSGRQSGDEHGGDRQHLLGHAEAQLGGDESFARFVETIFFGPFLAEHLHSAHRTERLLDETGQSTEMFTRLFRRFLDTTGEATNRPQQKRGDGDGNEGEQPIE